MGKGWAFTWIWSNFNLNPGQKTLFLLLSSSSPLSSSLSWSIIIINNTLTMPMDILRQKMDRYSSLVLPTLNTSAWPKNISFFDGFPHIVYGLPYPVLDYWIQLIKTIWNRSTSMLGEWNLDTGICFQLLKFLLQLLLLCCCYNCRFC